VTADEAEFDSAAQDGFISAQFILSKQDIKVEGEAANRCGDS
jgi:hypothetical protein